MYHLFGPNHVTGLVLSLHTGSNRILTPLPPSSAALVSTRKVACPIQVVFSPFRPWPQSGLRTGTSSSRGGTGTKLRSFEKRVWSRFQGESLTKLGHGFWKEFGGLPR